MPRRPFGSRIDRTVRRSAGTDSGPGPTRYPKHGPHGGGPAAAPALTCGGRSRDDLGRRPHSGCRGGRSARESTGRCACPRAPIPGRVRRVTRNTALTGAALPPPPPLPAAAVLAVTSADHRPAAALPPPPPSPAAAVLAMTSVGDRAADAEAAVRLANRPPPCRGESLGQVPNSVTTVRQSAPSSLGPGLEGCLRTAV